MTGGVAYVHDPDGDLRRQVNPDSVTVSGDLSERDETVLRRLVVNHAVYTGSERADALLDDWTAALEGFVRVFPEEYRRVLDRATVEDVRASPPAHARTGSDGPASVTSGDD
jgi:glutamate synthase (NADPH/NADH) large chain